MRTLPLLMVVALTAGCSAATPATQAPSTTLTAITPQVLGALIDEHDPGASAITGGEGSIAARPTEFVAGLTATAWHRAAPGRTKTHLTLSYTPTPFPTSLGCPPKTCTERDGVQVWTQPSRLISVREKGFAELSGSAEYLTGDRQAIAMALVSDERIGPLVTQSMADAAAANPRWLADPDGCRGARPAATVALPAVAGASEPVTPQALVAVVASRVAGSCASDESGTRDQITGVLRLDAEDETVSLSVATHAFTCPQPDACRTKNGITIARRLDTPEEYPATLTLARPLADGVHWAILTHGSLAPHRGRPFPVAMDVLEALVTDPRVQPSVDAALNRAGDQLPLPWRYSPTTSG